MPLGPGGPRIENVTLTISGDHRWLAAGCMGSPGHLTADRVLARVRPLGHQIQIHI